MRILIIRLRNGDSRQLTQPVPDASGPCPFFLEGTTAPENEFDFDEMNLHLLHR